MRLLAGIYKDKSENLDEMDNFLEKEFTKIYLIRDWEFRVVSV